MPGRAPSPVLRQDVRWGFDGPACTWEVPETDAQVRDLRADIVAADSNGDHAA